MQPTTPTPQPTLEDYQLALAQEATIAQIHALRTLVAISQDLSNPKEARIAATVILKFKPPAPPPPAAADDPAPQSSTPALPSTPQPRDIAHPSGRNHPATSPSQPATAASKNEPSPPDSRKDGNSGHSHRA